MNSTPKSLIDQLKDTVGLSVGSISTQTLARILAARFYSLSPAVFSCKLVFFHPLELLEGKERKLLTTAFKFTGFLDENVQLSQSSYHHVRAASKYDVVLRFYYPLETVPSEYFRSKTYASDVSRLVFEEVNPHHSYELKVAQELAHHLPLLAGQPVPRVASQLESVARSSAARIAPKGFFSRLEIDLPQMEPLRGTYFAVNDDMEDTFTKPSDHKPAVPIGGVHRAIIALGSNIGNRFEHIEDALHAMEDRGLVVQRVSPLYETEPMYVLDQDVFLNGVCEVGVQSIRQ